MKQIIAVLIGFVLLTASPGHATLIVNKAIASVVLSNLSQPYDGTVKCVLATTTPPGLGVSLTYNGSANCPIHTGIYTVIGTVNDTNYQGSVTNTLRIGPVMISNLNQLWTGVGMGDFHAVIPGYGYGVMFSNGATKYALDSITFEMQGGPGRLQVQIYSMQGIHIPPFSFPGSNMVPVGTLGNPLVDPRLTQWPNNTSFIDYTPLNPIMLEPNTSYIVTVTEPTNGANATALIYNQARAYTVFGDWSTRFSQWAYYGSNPPPGPPGGWRLNSSGGNMKVEIAASPVLLTVTAQSQMILDRQTGLYYQQVVVQNCGLGTIFGLRMTATNLPSIAVTNLVYMVSATGTNNNGAPYVEYSGSLSPGSTNTFTVSYYSKIRQAPTGVGLLVEPFNVVPPAVSTGTLLAIGSPFVRSDGKLAFQFSTLRGRTYVVDYSSDLVTWKQAQSTVIGNGGTVIWVDAGPPDTESAVVLGSRYYRVLLLPQ